MSELGEEVFNEVMDNWWNTTMKENGRLTIGDAVRKTIELMEDTFNIQYKNRIDRRINEIAMDRAKDINGIPVRTLIAKDIVTTMIGKAYLNTNMVYKDMADNAVRLTDELLKALNK